MSVVAIAVCRHPESFLLGLYSWSFIEWWQQHQQVSSMWQGHWAQRKEEILCCSLPLPDRLARDRTWQWITKHCSGSSWNALSSSSAPLVRCVSSASVQPGCPLMTVLYNTHKENISGMLFRLSSFYIHCQVSLLKLSTHFTVIYCEYAALIWTLEDTDPACKSIRVLSLIYDKLCKFCWEKGFLVSIKQSAE